MMGEFSSAAAWSPESEVAVIAAAMAYPAECGPAIRRLQPHHFFDGVHQAIWAVISTLLNEGRQPAPALVRDGLSNSAAFLEWGGLDQLAGLMMNGEAYGVGDHADAILDRAGRRALQDLATSLMGRASDVSGMSATDLAAEFELQAQQILRDAETRDHFIGAGEVIARALRAAKKRTGEGIEFGFGLTDLDDLTGGMTRGEVTLLAGRPGMAKSIALSHVAMAQAMQGRAGAFFSQEMAEEALGLRMACALAYDRNAVTYSSAPSSTNPWFESARKGRLSDGQWARLDEAQTRADPLPVRFDVRPNLTVAQIEAASFQAIRAWERAGLRPGCIYIDHIGKIRPKKDRQGSIRAETADISGDLSVMAKRLDLPVLAAAQLNRAVETRQDKVPELSDLREAGQLEEDARQVILLFRPEYYLRPPLDPSSETVEEQLKREEKLDRVRRKLHWIVAGQASRTPSIGD